MKKNDICVVKIEDMSVNGEGIGKADGYTLFIKDAVIGDVTEVSVMKVKKNYGYAKLRKVIEPSVDRVESKCKIARQCGGCQLQMLSYEKQLEFKENKVKNNLERIGGFENIGQKMEPIIGMKKPYRYRNKTQVPVGRDKDGKLVVGFYAGRTHVIIDQKDCYLAPAVNREIIEKVKKYMDDYGIPPYYEESHNGIIRHILIRVGFCTEEIMVCLVINGDVSKLACSEKLVESLLEIRGMKSISVNINKEKTNAILGKKIVNLYGEGYITDYIGDVKFQISPLSFYQINPMQTEKLYKTACEYAGLLENKNQKKEKVVWDLYCGIGTISLFLAQQAKKVYGVEIVEEAIRDAKNNAKINGIENVEFFVGKAEEMLPEKYREENIKADVVVVDPPRKGCDEAVLDTIAKMGVEKIVYVSCDSATLARDLRYLCDKGYELERVRTVDMFGMTTHVETVVLLSKVQN